MQTQQSITPEACADLHQVIGFSASGRPLLVRRLGSPAAPLRVLFVCGQHGDERGIRRALDEYLAQDANELRGGLPGLDFAILAEANPDGAAVRSRRNAQQVDLNRDHLWLQAPETRAIHGFVAAWQPHLVVDMHNFPSRRAHLVQQNLRLAADICLDFPTTPAALHSSFRALTESAMLSLDEHLSRHGFVFGRYCVLDSLAGVRHGTPDLVDARNVLTMRYGCLTLLLEARNPARLEPPEDRAHVRRAVAEACRGLVRWCVSHEPEIVAYYASSTGGGRVPVRYKRPFSEEPAHLSVVRLDTGSNETLLVPRYRPRIEPCRSIPMPYGYAVPLALRAVVELLARHGFRGSTRPPAAGLVSEELHLSETTPETRGPESVSLPNARHGRRWPRVERGVACHASLEGYAIYPASQRGGRLLSLLLEPESRFALHRLPQFCLPAIAGMVYPIRRVHLSNAPAAAPDGAEVNA